MIQKGSRVAKRLILASASPRRKELLEALGVSVKVVPAHVEEKIRIGEGPVQFVRRLAKEKAEKVSVRFPDCWVLGADTIVILGAKVLGKPKDRREAERFLSALSGKTHRVVTACCLTKSKENKTLLWTVSTRVTFKDMKPEEIRWYVRTGEPLDKAGAYGIQGKGAFCVKTISGSYTNVVGLPLTEVLEALETYAGFRLK